jgi:hypothetical protein
MQSCVNFTAYDSLVLLITSLHQFQNGEVMNTTKRKRDLNPWLSNIKYFGDAQKDEINIHAILNPSHEKRDELHALTAVIETGTLALWI